MKEQSKPNIWKWLFLAIVFGVAVAAVWEFAARRPKTVESPITALAQTETTKPVKTETVKRIKGNRSSMIYHLPGCASYNRIEDKNIVWFATNEEAEAAGFRMAKNC
jgi:hypothetical protein